MLSPGAILQNRYRIVRELGHGGMGIVYQAIDQRVNSLVALKETQATSGREARRAFELEAAMLANLRHPCLPKVMDYFSENDGDYLVMEFIPGHDLAELLALRGRPFAEAEVLGWADSLLGVLEYLHRNKVFHRDIKPANVKLTDDGELFLLDFGLAKGSVGQMPTVSAIKSAHGFTPLYASIEQILGQGTDVRSDLYSLGATLYHLLTGVAPVDAATRSHQAEEEGHDPLPLMQNENPLISPHVAGIVHSAMAISRKRRPRSAAEMRTALLGLAASKLDPGPPQPVAAPVPPPPTKKAPEPRPIDPAYIPTMPASQPPKISGPSSPRIFATDDPPPNSGLQRRALVRTLLIAVGAMALLGVFSVALVSWRTGWVLWSRRNLYSNGESTASSNSNLASAVASPAPGANPTASPVLKGGTLMKNTMGMDFIYVPSGTFVMGTKEKESATTDQPAHRVTIGYGFYLGKYEVTQAQWQAIMANNPSQYPDCGPDCPVESVSWNAVQEFIAVLNRANDAYTYRLPSEAEWEYACRAGATDRTSWPLDRVAWWSPDESDARTGKRSYPPDFRPTHPVGLKRPNAFGLHDMLGNVSEWCQDFYHDSYVGSPVDGSPWLASARTAERVLRGGSSFQNDAEVRYASRFKSMPDIGGETLDDQFNGFGFRLVAVPRTTQ